MMVICPQHLQKDVIEHRISISKIYILKSKFVLPRVSGNDGGSGVELVVMVVVVVTGSEVSGNGIIMEIHPRNRAPTGDLARNPSKWSHLYFVVVLCVHILYTM